MDVLFEGRVPARKFKSTQVDAFRGDSVVVVADDDLEKSISGTQKIEQLEKADEKRAF